MGRELQNERLRMRRLEHKYKPRWEKLKEIEEKYENDN